MSEYFLHPLHALDHLLFCVTERDPQKALRFRTKSDARHGDDAVLQTFFRDLNVIGKILLGRNQSSPPSGVAAINDEQKLLKNVATGALIAVIGDDNNDFIYIGATREFVATRDGALFLGINEGNLEDNSGSYNIKVEIIPDDGE